MPVVQVLVERLELACPVLKLISQNQLAQTP